MFTPAYRAARLHLVTVALIACACGPKQTEPISGETLIIFPPPPDTPRIQFLTRFGSSQDITGNQESLWQSIIGASDEEVNKPIVKPYGIAIHKSKIYICDTILGLLEVIDLEARTFEYFSPRGMGQLKKPINCFVDKEQDRLYVADIERGQVVVFDSAGSYVGSFGEGESVRPTDVFVGEDRVWMSDIGNGKIHVFNKADYERIATLPRAQPGEPGSLRQPTNLHVIEDRLYVSDFGDFNVKIYTLNGEFVSSIGSYGRALGQFVRPKGIAVDRESNLYVVDSAFQNVQVFDREGQLLMFFGGSYAGPGYLYLPAKIIIDYDNLEYFRQFVHSSFDLKYLLFVTNQYGPDKVSVYGFVEPKAISTEAR